MSGSIILFSDSGLGKTSQSGLVAKYLYRKSGGKPIRLVSADGGGWLPLQPRVDAGIVIPFNIQPVPDTLMLIRKLRQGWWPDKLTIGGQLMEGAKITSPPGTTSQSQLKWLHENVGGYIVEGLTSISELILSSLAHNYGQVGMKGAYELKLKDTTGLFEGGDEKIGANALDHFGIAQREVIDMVRWFGSLPVERVLFTAHEATGEDKEGSALSRPIRGPALAGKAATDKIAKHSAECIHIENVLLDGGKNEYRSYFTPHPDPAVPNVMYKACKARVPLEKMEELLKMYPGGYFVCTLESGMAEFLMVEDELIAQAGEADRKLVEEMRGGGGR